MPTSQWIVSHRQIDCTYFTHAWWESRTHTDVATIEPDMLTHALWPFRHDVVMTSHTLITQQFQQNKSPTNMTCVLYHKVMCPCDIFQPSEINPHDCRQIQKTNIVIPAFVTSCTESDVCSAIGNLLISFKTLSCNLFKIVEQCDLGQYYTTWGFAPIPYPEFRIPCIPMEWRKLSTCDLRLVTFYSVFSSQ